MSTLAPPLVTPAARATRVRYRVVAMGVLLAMVTYLDRACISTLAPLISRDLSLSDMQMSWVFSAFALAYALLEIPTASWADRAGTRNVLTRIVVWWSGFTIATAAAVGYHSLLAIRFLFGAGEAGAWPSIARTFAQWIPRRERGTVQGIFFAGAHLGGGLTPLLVLYLLDFYNWRAIFVLFGLLGFLWATVWFRWFRDDPAQHPAVNEAELAAIVAGRDLGARHEIRWAYWRRLATHPNIWALCLMYFPNTFLFYFCLTWLPAYLHDVHGFTAMSKGFFTGLPLMLSVPSDLFGGMTTDWAVARFGPRWGRTAVGGIAYLFAGAAMLAVPHVPHPVAAAVLIALAMAANMFILGAAWSTCLDIGGRNAGVVSAAMNTSGGIGAVLCPLIVTMLKARVGWNAPLVLFGVLFLIGAACWCVIDPRRRVFDSLAD